MRRRRGRRRRGTLQRELRAVGAELRTRASEQSALLILAAGAALLLSVDYVVALGTQFGLRADGAAIARGFAGPEWRQAREATLGLVHTIDITSLAIVGTGIVGLALLRGRPRHALAAAAVIGGANLTTQALKPILAYADPFGGDSARALEQHFPSGHATVAMSVPLALMLACPPAWRAAANLVAIGSAAVIGIGLLLIGWHYPSDVLGAYLVATVWTALAAATLNAWAPQQLREGPIRASRMATVSLAGVLVIATLGLIAFALHEADLGRLHLHGRLHLAFLLAASAVAFAAVALPTALHRLLDDHARG